MSFYVSTLRTPALRLLRAPTTTQFARTRSLATSSPKPGQNSTTTEIPSFNPREIWRSASPRARVAMGVGLALAAGAEAATWFHFFGGKKSSADGAAEAETK